MPGKDKNIIVKPCGALPPRQALGEAALLQGLLPLKQGSGLGGDFGKGPSPRRPPGSARRRYHEELPSHLPKARNCRIISLPCRRSASSSRGLKLAGSTGSEISTGTWLWSRISGKPAACSRAREARESRVRELTRETGVNRAESATRDPGGPGDGDTGARGRAAEHHLPACSPTAARGTCSGVKGSARSWSPAQGSGSGEPRSASR